MKKNEKLQALISTPVGKIGIWCILKIYTFIFMGFAFLPLVLLSYERYGRVYAAVYYNAYIFFGGYVLLSSFIKPILRGKRSERNHQE